MFGHDHHERYLTIGFNNEHLLRRKTLFDLKASEIMFSLGRTDSLPED